MQRILQALVLVVAGVAPLYASVDSALLALVPSGSKVLASIDVDRARNSEFGQYALRQVDNGDQGFQSFIQTTGFDPRRDIQQFVFATPNPGARGADARFAILLRGTFDQGRLEKAAQSKGATVRTLGGVNIFTDRSHDGHTGFAFPEVGVAILADVHTLEEVIANRGNSSTLDPEMLELVSRAGTNNDMWFVSLVPGSFLANHMPSEARSTSAGPQALQAVLRSSGGVQFGTDVRVFFDADTRSPQDAASLADVIRFVASTIQMQRTKDPRATLLAPALDSISLSSSGSSVHVSVSIPERTLEQLTELRPSSSQSATPRSRVGTGRR